MEEAGVGMMGGETQFGGGELVGSGVLSLNGAGMEGGGSSLPGGKGVRNGDVPKSVGDETTPFGVGGGPIGDVTKENAEGVGLEGLGLGESGSDPLEATVLFAKRGGSVPDSET
jgi:hypothetical protein